MATLPAGCAGCWRQLWQSDLEGGCGHGPAPQPSEQGMAVWVVHSSLLSGMHGSSWGGPQRDLGEGV